jgi:hypothetical protein
MGKPLSKVWKRGHFDVLGEREEVTKSEVQHVSGKHVLMGIKVRPQAFPTGLPMSPFSEVFCIIEDNYIQSPSNHLSPVHYPVHAITPQSKNHISICRNIIFI